MVLVMIAISKIKGLAEEFDGDFECLSESKEKCITFSVIVKKNLMKREL